MSEARIAQVGCGHWGANLARNFAELGALVAVVDDDSETARRAGDAHGVPVRSLADVLADEAITAVALATPASTHGELALRAIDRGKHVFIEKPLALSIAEAERVIHLSEQARRTVMIGHLLQYHPIFIRLLEIVRAGELGAIRYVYSRRLSLGKLRIEEDVLWSFAPHDISMLLALAGSEPVSVTAAGSGWVTPGIADWCTAHLRFPGGLMGHVEVSWMHPFKEQRCVVVGDQGMAVFEDSLPDWDRRLAIYRHTVDRSKGAPFPIRANPEYFSVPKSEPLREECRHFIHCVEEGRVPRTDVHEGLRVLRTLRNAQHALNESCHEPDGRASVGPI